jgi:hypothetical protein
MHGKSSGTAQGVAVQRATAAKGSEADGGAATAIAIQAAAAAKGSEAGGGGTVGADATMAQMQDSPQQEGSDVNVTPVVGVAPQEET